jgi:hypothetical protein
MKNFGTDGMEGDGMVGHESSRIKWPKVDLKIKCAEEKEGDSSVCG